MVLRSVTNPPYSLSFDALVSVSVPPSSVYFNATFGNVVHYDNSPHLAKIRVVRHVHLEFDSRIALPNMQCHKPQPIVQAQDSAVGPWVRPKQTSWNQIKPTDDEQLYVD